MASLGYRGRGGDAERGGLHDNSSWRPRMLSPQSQRPTFARLADHPIPHPISPSLRVYPAPPISQATHSFPKRYPNYAPLTNLSSHDTIDPHTVRRTTRHPDLCPDPRAQTILPQRPNPAHVLRITPCGLRITHQASPPHPFVPFVLLVPFVVPPSILFSLFPAQNKQYHHRRPPSRLSPLTPYAYQDTVIG